MIPWSTLRELTDAGYAAHLAQAADESARRVGARIRELRVARGLSGKELAERAGIPPRTLSRIEQGKQEMVLSTVQSLLAAMGCTLSHMVAEAAEATEPPEVAAPR